LNTRVPKCPYFTPGPVNLVESRRTHHQINHCWRQIWFIAVEP
jgi:hypothetical protein